VSRAVGIDFGTTNSAVAIADETGAVTLMPLPAPGGGVTSTWRTLLFFESGEHPGEVLISAGTAAIERYAESGGQGRLIQSIKSHLASELFSGTQAAGRHYRIEDLIATFLRKLRGAVGIDLGRRAVVGRPVRYWGAQTAEDEARALARMTTALGLAGFDDVSFEYEPVAAARRYAARLDHEELVVIADFGGGTSDFSVVRVGGKGPAEVLATSGVAVAGDAFDARLVDQVVSPSLGRGSSYQAEFGRAMPVPPWLYSNLRRWHHLSFLRSPKTTALLDKIRHGASDPDGIERLIHIIEDDLGLPLHQAIETNKRALSESATAPFRFDHAGLSLHGDVSRADFDAWIAEDLAAIDEAVQEALARAGVAAAAIQRVFATGGSSLVPAVRASLANTFGADRLVGGDELTSVAWGLAAVAAER
jgi:hypothetical chaperone protein